MLTLTVDTLIEVNFIFVKNAAVADYYTNMEETMDEKNKQAIAKYEFLSRKINPLIAVIFVISYWYVLLSYD